MVLQYNLIYFLQNVLWMFLKFNKSNIKNSLDDIIDLDKFYFKYLGNYGKNILLQKL